MPTLLLLFVLCASIKEKQFYDPFLWTGLNCLKATESLQGESLLFTTIQLLILQLLFFYSFSFILKILTN